MSSNPTDNTYSIVRNTSVGVIPATPAFLYLDNTSSADFNLDSKNLNPTTMKQNRAMAGMRKTAFSAKGTLKFEFRRDNGCDLLIESGLSGKFDSNGKLVAGNTDTYHTIEKTFNETSTGSVVVQRKRYTDMMVSKFGLSVSADGFANANYDLIGTGRVYNAPIITGASYTAATQGPQLIGSDMHSISIAGLTGVYQTLDLTVDHSREAEFGMGNDSAFDIGTKGGRQVKLTVKLFRQDFSPEMITATDTPLAISFNLGAVGTGYSFVMPQVVASLPKDDASGSKNMVTIDFMATDQGAGYDLSITKL